MDDPEWHPNTYLSDSDRHVARTMKSYRCAPRQTHIVCIADSSQPWPAELSTNSGHAFDDALHEKGSSEPSQSMHGCYKSMRTSPVGGLADSAREGTSGLQRVKAPCVIQLWTERDGSTSWLQSSFVWKPLRKHVNFDSTQLCRLKRAASLASNARC
ncbi:hypothetical protein BDU57DRAFT_513032 [Ampelomyces quisqualis]|uniref:Uncharacterized protein n=1 Tax=Ampelomyces quisqualis TaxID=50730 RepID=A0A6A5QWD1_AMPQU|nr:hypothetical protein BDU57DRAFT_513032 [Ampelomyces quisqualis]